MASEKKVILGAILLGWVALGPGAARADDYEDPELADLGGMGDVVPMNDAGLRLVSESLRLVLFDGFGYRVQAEYVLSNPGPPRDVTLGIPTSWDREELEYSMHVRDLVEAGGKELELRTGGKTYSCRPQVTQDRAFRWDPASPPINVNVWCVVTVKVASGDAIPLSIEYRGRGLAPAGKVFLLAPTGSWREPVKELRILVESRGDVNVVWPPGARAGEGGLVRWEGRDVRPSELGAVVVQDSSERGWDGGWMRRAVRLSATASSVLAQQGKRSYGAGNAVDDDAGSAWCEGGKGHGTGQWLRVVLQPEAPRSAETCAIRDILVLPGYGRDEKTFAANGRVKGARIEDCTDAAAGFDVELQSSASPRDPRDRGAAQPVAVPGDVFRGVPACIRMVIKDVETGTYPDTCASQLVPRVFCKAR